MIEKLKEYKEIITIIVFFLGGFVWLEAKFPQKSDLTYEIDYLNCRLTKQMELTQTQLRFNTLYQEYVECDRQISMFSNVILSPAMKQESDRLTANRSVIMKDLSSVKSDLVKISDENAKDVCRKPRG